MLNNPNFKGVEFDPLLRQAGSNAFTLSPSRWIELTDAIKERNIRDEPHLRELCLEWYEQTS